MKQFVFLLALPLLSLVFLSCQKEEPEPVDAERAAMVEHLQQVLRPLSSEPLDWSDDELRWLDPVADSRVVGLGEATHGTAEFFEAKHRIFRYLVERHGFRVFAIEAQFGESLLIDEAIQESRTQDIEPLMREVMLFWTWRTEEVKQLLEWMSEYNRGKPAAEKLHYVGFDCQATHFHRDLLRDYLTATEAPFLALADTVLQEMDLRQEFGFGNFTEENFEDYLARIDRLRTAMEAAAPDLIARSSEEDYRRYLRLLEVTRQASEVRYQNDQRNFSRGFTLRDRGMADNTIWWSDYYGGAKTVVWAHNAHVANDGNFLDLGSTQGFQLRRELREDYAIVGFLFTRGTFTAVGDMGLATQEIDFDPPSNSMNDFFHAAGAPVFAVAIDELEQSRVWDDAFFGQLTHKDIGASYNETPGNYYRPFRRGFYDWIIYFEETKASLLIEQ